MTKDSWVRDVNFVLTECRLFLEDTTGLGPAQGAKVNSPFEKHCFLPTPDGSGTIVCGVEATKCLERLSNAALLRSDAYGTLAIYRVFNSLKSILVGRFLGEGRTVDTQQIERALAAAVREAKKSRYDATHFIPCRLAQASEPLQFRIGPVIFRPLNVFYAHMQPHFAARREAHQSEFVEKEERTRMEAYYGTFNWVAEVRVLNCDDETSEQRARRAVTAAVDLLRVIFGGHYTEELIVGGPALRSGDHRMHLRLGTDGVLDVLSSWTRTVPASLSHGWSKRLVQRNVLPLLEIGGRIVASIVDPSLDRPLTRRLVDSASWYGQAVLEEFGAGRIVKAVSALERLVLTDKEDVITTTFSDRGAALATLPISKINFAGWQECLKFAYDLRSQLVHGSLSPFDAEVGFHADWCLSVAEQVMRGGLVKMQGVLELHMSNGETTAWFDHLVEGTRQAKKE